MTLISGYPGVDNGSRRLVFNSPKIVLFKNNTLIVKVL